MKRFIAPLTLSFLGFIAIITFNIIGSSVSDSGELIEPFFLLGIGIFALIIAFFWAFVSIIIILVKQTKQKNR